jgi:hypothetical protein
MCGISMRENREIPRLAHRSDDRWAAQGTLQTFSPVRGLWVSMVT